MKTAPRRATGTASATEQVPTSWFVGWGPVNDPQYLIAVVIEKGGYGASAAAPVAKSGFSYLVEPDKYSGGVIFRSERVGAFFYVAPENENPVREVMRRGGFEPYDLA